MLTSSLLNGTVTFLFVRRAFGLVPAPPSGLLDAETALQFRHDEKFRHAERECRHEHHRQDERQPGFDSPARRRAGPRRGAFGPGWFAIFSHKINLRLAFQIDERLQDVIAGGDDLAVGFIRALGRDERGELAARSTFDISKDPGLMVPKPPLPGAPAAARPPAAAGAV